MISALSPCDVSIKLRPKISMERIHCLMNSKKLLIILWVYFLNLYHQHVKIMACLIKRFGGFYNLLFSPEFLNPRIVFNILFSVHKVKYMKLNMNYKGAPIPI